MMASREPLIEPYRPHEPEQSYDDDYYYDVEPERSPAGGERPRVLWGRVAILGGALLLAFLIGRSSAPDGIPEADLAAARADAREAQGEVDELRAQIATLQTETQGLDEEKASGETEAGDEGDAEGTAVENQTYTVKAGDTLSKIAERFYGNASLDDFLAEANPGVDPYALRVGQELVIPPNPEE